MNLIIVRYKILQIHLMVYHYQIFTNDLLLLGFWQFLYPKHQSNQGSILLLGIISFTYVLYYNYSCKLIEFRL